MLFGAIRRPFLRKITKMIRLLLAIGLVLSISFAVGAQEPAAPAAEAKPAVEAPASAAEAPAKEEATEAKPPAADETPDKNAGQAQLDQAMERKITAEGMGDLGEVVELLEEALEKGLDEENSTLARQVLVSTLMQRATALTRAVLERADTIQQDARLLQIRQVALTDLQRATEIDPTLDEGFFMIGRLQSLPLGDQNAARLALSKALEIEGLSKKKRAEAYAMRASTQAKPERRLSDIDEAVKLDSKKVDYLLLRAKHYQAEQEPEKCLADLDAAIALEPKNPSVHELKALMLLAQDKPELALESFNKASELAPDEIAPYQYRGEVYRQLGDLKKAIAELDKALEKDPENIASLLIRSELYVRDEQSEKALADVDAVLSRRPGMVQAQLMRARILELLERNDEAISALEQLAAAAPANPEIQLQLASQYLTMDQPLKGIDALTRVIDLVGDNEIALRLRGDTYLTIGKHAEAIADFAKVLELNPEESGVLNNYAWTLATSPMDDLRDGKRAIELATKACEVTEFKKAHILSTLGAAYAEVGEWDKAVEWAQKAVDQGKADVKEEADKGPGDDPLTHDAELARLGQLVDDLNAELANYKAKKPSRELQQLAAEKPATPAEEPAPEQTIEL